MYNLNNNTEINIFNLVNNSYDIYVLMISCQGDAISSN